MSGRRSPELDVSRLPLGEALTKPVKLPHTKSAFPGMGSIEFRCPRPNFTSISEMLGEKRLFSNKTRRRSRSSRAHGSCWECKVGDPIHANRCILNRLKASSPDLSLIRPDKFSRRLKSKTQLPTSSSVF